MSYELEITRNAMGSLAQLDHELQEDVLDEVERIIEEPFSVTVRGGMPGAVCEVVRHEADTVDYVFIVVDVDHRAQLVSVRAIGHVFRKTS